MGDYRGLAGMTEPEPTKGTVVIFHGNGGTAADRVFYVMTLGSLGYRVILAEYPRYGGRKGELGEKSFVDDGNETVRLAFEKYGAPFFLLGESLGCGVAAAVAKETSVEIDGIVLITPWDTLESVARSKFPFLPVRWLLKDKYDTIGNLKSFQGRVAVVGAGRDGLVPIRHAQNLYHSLSRDTTKMWTIEGAGHNDWPMFTNVAWWKEVMDFVSNSVTAEKPGSR
jgi:pimeloyl-ACP methyl ester carboxylesterase